jgi:hypothetical protein
MLLTATTSPRAGLGVTVVVLLLGAYIFTRVVKARRNDRGPATVKGERVRPLAITALDPVISLFLIGPVFWHWVSLRASFALAAVVGGLLGVVVGWLRRRAMYVRSIPESKSIVLRRSGLEYALVAFLLVARSSETYFEQHPNGVGQSLFVAAISLALFEAISRSAFIVYRYYND